jgi:triacylglycerol esterase/lipase EstA (alpha/beta hydrolase family)
LTKYIVLGQPTRALPDSSSNLFRSSSYESIHKAKEEDERKRQIKSRNRACNDSFRQAVDKSYCQNNHDGMRRKFKIF